MFDKITRPFQPKPKVDPTITGVLGTAVGVAIGTAATMYFSKAENRQKVTEKVKDIKDRAQKLLAKSETKAQDQKKQLQLK